MNGGKRSRKNIKVYLLIVRRFRLSYRVKRSLNAI